MSPNYITRIFGSSPVRPLQSHMEKVVACVAQLVPFIEAVISKDPQACKQQQQRIVELEQEADDLKKELRQQLPKGLLLPVSRRDLLEVLTMQDRVANKTKDIAGLMLGRKMQLPDEISQPYLDFVKRCIDANLQAQKAINELDELVETGFKGVERTLVVSMIDELDQIESDTDRMQVEIRAKLFAVEQNYPPIDMVFLYKIIEWTGDLADLAQRVGSRLQLMLAK